MIQFQDLATTQCIICGKTAKWWTGHLHLIGNHRMHISAGFCENCVNQPHATTPTRSCRVYTMGCFGWYDSAYGLQVMEE